MTNFAPPEFTSLTMPCRTPPPKEIGGGAADGVPNVPNLCRTSGGAGGAHGYVANSERAQTSPLRAAFSWPLVDVAIARSLRVVKKPRRQSLELLPSVGRKCRTGY
jgi:hypothetical protein